MKMKQKLNIYYELTCTSTQWHGSWLVNLQVNKAKVMLSKIRKQLQNQYKITSSRFFLIRQGQLLYFLLIINAM